MTEAEGLKRWARMKAQQQLEKQAVKMQQRGMPKEAIDGTLGRLAAACGLKWPIERA